MKIALLHYASPPVIGGVETILGAHAELFRKHGHDVLVLSQRGDADVILERGRTAADYRRVLSNVLRDRDVVFVHNVMTMPFDLDLTAALKNLAAELPATRFVAWVHDVAAVNPDFAPVPELVRKAVPGFTYVAVSESRAREFESVTGLAARVVPNGIDPTSVLGLTREMAAFAEEFGLFDERPILFHPTRLLRRKNVELGIEVIGEMRASGARLLITAAEDPHNSASQEYAVWLRAERARLGLEERVIFVSDHLRVDDAVLAGLYRLADALFLPSRQEGFGLPVLEAALHRLPAIVSDIPPLRELAHANTRAFALKSSPSELASLIEETLRSDRALEARKRALESRWSQIYTRHLVPLLSGN